MDEHAAIALARDQHGMITRAQAQALGMTERMVDGRLATGRWQRVRPGVYLLGAAPRSWIQEVAAACLAAGPDAAASHRTAARLWGLVERSGRIEVLVDGERRVRLPRVAVHRSVLVAPGDRAVRSGIPTTSVARTLIDLAPANGAETMGRWIDHACRDLALDLEVLIECCLRLTVPGRPAPRSAMEALALRRPGHDPGRSALESRALAVLSRYGLPEPVRQLRVRRPDGSSAYIDLAYPGPRVAIELDGWHSHGIRAAFEPDRMRGNDLVLAGWHLLRFTWGMSDRYLASTAARAIGVDLGIAALPPAS